MKYIVYVFKQTLSAALFLCIAPFVMAQNIPSTPITTCENIVKNFDKSALAALFDQQVIINLQAQYHFIDAAPSGCIVHTMVKFPNSSYSLNMTNGYYDLGTAIIFRQSNSKAMYESNKQAFAAEGSIFNWQNTLPDVQTGYVDPTDPGYQVFDALLTDNDYVIFTYKGINNSDSQNSTPNYLDAGFAKFINVMASQIIKN